jgi:hypothetical protein
MFHSRLENGDWRLPMNRGRGGVALLQQRAESSAEDELIFSFIID